jgi:hypothetical protein
MAEFDKEITDETSDRAERLNVTLDQAVERSEQLRRNRSAATLPEIWDILLPL